MNRPPCTKIMYMISRELLVDEIEALTSEGNMVTCVTPLREMREPNMDGVVITDWLIVYYPFGRVSGSL